jgi:molybdopterin molybdotransferase
MLELEAAQQRIASLIQPLDAESVALGQGFERFTAEKIVAPSDLPAFDNSAMDGYAVGAEDLRAASSLHPVSLCLVGRVMAGELFCGNMGPGQCVRVFTGSPLPLGANAVVMQEDTRLDPAQPQTVCFNGPIAPGENVRRCGDDLRRGATLVESGVRLSAAQLCLLAAAGITQVRVSRRPAIALLATGSELQESGQPLKPGQIYESTRVGLTALLTRSGAIPRVFPIVPDTFEATREALARAFSECEAVVTSGGASVGESDWVRSAFQAIGGELDFWRVAIRPGKPFAFGLWQGKYLFGLPGNPASALVTFLLLVRPALARMQGAAELASPCHAGILEEALENQGDRRLFVRVRVDQAGKVRSAGGQGAHILSSFALANGLVAVPPNSTLAAGSWAQVYRWD